MDLIRVGVNPLHSANFGYRLAPFFAEIACDYHLVSSPTQWYSYQYLDKATYTYLTVVAAHANGEGHDLRNQRNETGPRSGAQETALGLDT